MTSGGSLHILISGAGIAGPVVAFFLAKAGAKVTVVERAPVPRTGGQNVDVRGHGLTIIQRMGLEAKVRAKTTREKGLRFVHQNNAVAAEFPVGSGDGFTGEIEIMRGELGNILYEATRDGVEYVFGESIATVTEMSDAVEVEFENRLASRKFDAVVGADGWASVTRKLAFGSEVSRAGVQDLKQWAAWFTIPHEPQDDEWARWCNASGKRMMLVRPDNHEVTRVSLWVMNVGEKMESMVQASPGEQKRYWGELFSDAGWESDRLLAGMHNADDFYMQKIAQVKLDRLSTSRVVLVGDSGSCPSPVSGMGTTVAIVGAYVLAGELIKHGKDVTSAFTAYEDQTRKFVAIAQKLAPGTPSAANPDSGWGIILLYWFLRFIAWSGIQQYMGASFTPPASAFQLPEYGSDS